MAGFGKVLAFAAAVFAAGAGASFADVPRWSLGTSYVNHGVEILAVDESGAVWLAVLGGGIQNNMRIGAFCSAFNSEGKYVGDLVVVEARSDRCVAAVLGESEIRGGDKAYIKIAK